MNDDKKQEEAPAKQSPSLTLLSGQHITAETVADMFEKLTGKRPTAAEIEEARIGLEQIRQESSQESEGT